MHQIGRHGGYSITRRSCATTRQRAPSRRSASYSCGVSTSTSTPGSSVDTLSTCACQAAMTALAPTRAAPPAGRRTSHDRRSRDAPCRSPTADRRWARATRRHAPTNALTVSTRTSGHVDQRRPHRLEVGRGDGVQTGHQRRQLAGLPSGMVQTRDPGRAPRTASATSSGCAPATTVTSGSPAACSVATMRPRTSDRRRATGSPAFGRPMRDDCPRPGRSSWHHVAGMVPRPEAASWS